MHLLTHRPGRQWAFNFTCLISAAFGLGLGGTNTYNAFLVLTAFTGFGIGGNIPIDTTICLEFIPQVSTKGSSARNQADHYSEQTFPSGATISLAAYWCRRYERPCLRLHPWQCVHSKFQRTERASIM